MSKPNSQLIRPEIRDYWAKQNWQVKKFDNMWVKVWWSDNERTKQVAYITHNGIIRCWLNFLHEDNGWYSDGNGWRDQDEAAKLLRLKAFL